MDDEHPEVQPPPEEPGEEVGADTEKFRAFVREGEQLEREEQPGNTLRVLSLVIGLLLLAAVIALLLR